MKEAPRVFKFWGEVNIYEEGKEKQKEEMEREMRKEISRDGIQEA